MSGCSTRSRRRGFSLIELLMAIFILGIGIISIASLFPAGIAQQRNAVDAQVGPLVARNAMSLLRTRIPSGIFGHVESADGDSPWDIHAGDFPWLRPSVVVETNAGSGIEIGAIDIFDTLDWPDYGFGAITTVGEKNYADPWLANALNPATNGIPYSLNLPAPPVVVIEQEERQYPREDGSGRAPRYYWDCMFRRTGGKMKVAIFVYRMNAIGEVEKTWRSSPSEDGFLQMPWMLDLESSGTYQPWRVGQGAGAVKDRSQWLLQGAGAGDPFDPMVLNDCWQCPGQWLVDQNGIIHTVSVGRSYKDDPRTHTELSRPVPDLQEDSLHIPQAGNQSYEVSPANRVESTGSLILPSSARFDPAFSYRGGMVTRDLSGGPDMITGGPVVSRLWYLPGEVEDQQGTPWSVTPVYILVEEF
ncbi:MAG: type II secretion system protein [Planctomycetota bacterium]|nr:type II secretion system protein [Planctomycetota bacterium]